MQRKVAAHQRVYLGEAQEEQELEEDPQGNASLTQTFNLIEFLLKNGPPSIISNFKYDLYQLRTFESYSNYVDGLDKGEPSNSRITQSANGPRLWSGCSATNNSWRRSGSRPRTSERRCRAWLAAEHTATPATGTADTEEATAATTPNTTTTTTRRRTRANPMITATALEHTAITHTTSPLWTSTKTPRTTSHRPMSTRRRRRSQKCRLRPRSPLKRWPASCRNQERRRK